MARVLCGEKEITCRECDSCDACEFWIEASVLYTAGYRKQSEVVEKIFGEIYEVLNELYGSANNACHNNMLYGNTDSPWGMRDVGVAIGIQRVGNAIRKIESKMKGDKTDA